MAKDPLPFVGIAVLGVAALLLSLIDPLVGLGVATTAILACVYEWGPLVTQDRRLRPAVFPLFFLVGGVTAYRWFEFRNFTIALLWLGLGLALSAILWTYGILLRAKSNDASK